MDESKRKTVMIIVIVVCLGAAGAVFWGTRSGGGGGIDDISEEEMIWVKCANKTCNAGYETGKKAYFKYIEEHGNPLAQSAPPLVCEKCGEQSVYRAEKCQNPSCGIVFFSNSVPNDYADRCPECKQSATEESRKRRKAAGAG